jgi:hypothetical protein
MDKQNPSTKFVHPAEETFAQILDFYGIPWEYEPRTFPLEWGENGNVTEAFAPDFYLPEYLLIRTVNLSVCRNFTRM